MIPIYAESSSDRGLEYVEEIKRVLARSQYILGPECKAFETEFAAFQGQAHCVGVANGTDALELALRAVGIKAGDTVCTVANAGFYSTAAILAVGATPVFVDICLDDLLMDPAKLADAVKTAPSAVIATHLYGRAARIREISNLCVAAKIPLVEDCAQAHGALVDGKRVGTFGAAGCFSFYPTKNLGAFGDGGAVVSNSQEVAQNAATLRQYGWSNKYHVSIAGGRNSRLDEIQAAVLRKKLPALDENNAKRRKIAREYTGAFAHLELECPRALEFDYVGHLYVVRTANRTRLKEFLAGQGIASDIHYPIPDNSQKINFKHKIIGGLENTIRACDEVLTLPCYPGLGADQQAKVIEAVVQFHK